MSQLARISTFKAKLKNKQYHFKAPGVERHDVCEIVAVIHFIKVIIKNNVNYFTLTSLIKGSLKVHASLASATIKDLVHLQLIFDLFSFSQHWNFCIPKVIEKKLVDLWDS